MSPIIKHHKTKLNHIPKRGILTDQLIRELFWEIWDEQQRQGDMCQSALKQDTWSKSARMTTSARRRCASLMCSSPFYSDPHNHMSPLIRKSRWKRSTDINPKKMHHVLPEVMIMIPDQKQSIWLIWHKQNSTYNLLQTAMSPSIKITEEMVSRGARFLPSNTVTHDRGVSFIKLRATATWATTSLKSWVTASWNYVWSHVFTDKN